MKSWSSNVVPPFIFKGPSDVYVVFSFKKSNFSELSMPYLVFNVTPSLPVLLFFKDEYIFFCTSVLDSPEMPPALETALLAFVNASNFVDKSFLNFTSSCVSSTVDEYVITSPEVASDKSPTFLVPSDIDCCPNFLPDCNPPFVSASADLTLSADFANGFCFIFNAPTFPFAASICFFLSGVSFSFSFFDTNIVERSFLNFTSSCVSSTVSEYLIIESAAVVEPPLFVSPTFLPADNSCCPTFLACDNFCSPSFLILPIFLPKFANGFFDTFTLALESPVVALNGLSALFVVEVVLS